MGRNAICISKCILLKRGSILLCFRFLFVLGDYSVSSLFCLRLRSCTPTAKCVKISCSPPTRDLYFHRRKITQMARMTTETTVINDALIFTAQLLKLQKRDSSFSLTKIADKLLVLDSWILFTISLTALICSYSGLSRTSLEFNKYCASLSSSSVNFDVSLSVER